MPTNPNSCPRNGNIAKTIVVEPNPMSDVKTTDPQDAHPTPNKLVAMPAKETPKPL